MGRASLASLAQVDGKERFAKLVEFLRKKLGRDQLVRAFRSCRGRSLGAGSRPHAAVQLHRSVPGLVQPLSV